MGLNKLYRKYSHFYCRFTHYYFTEKEANSNIYRFHKFGFWDFINDHQVIDLSWFYYRLNKNDDSPLSIKIAEECIGHVSPKINTGQRMLLQRSDQNTKQWLSCLKLTSVEKIDNNNFGTTFKGVKRHLFLTKCNSYPYHLTFHS